MKSCAKCGASIEDAASFCAHCGAPQEEHAAPAQADAAASSPVEMSAGHAPGAAPASSETAEKIAAMQMRLQSMPYGSAVLIIISVFMPWVSLGRMFDVTVMDVSKGLMLGIIAIACAAVFSLVKRRNYVVGLAMAHSFILFAIAAFIKYQSALSEVKHGFLGVMASSAISLDWGVIPFVVGALWLTVESVLLAAHAHGEPFEMNVLAARWKELATSKLNFASLELPTWVYSVVLAGLLFLLLMQSKAVQMMH